MKTTSSVAAAQGVEAAVRAVYEYCPPTLTTFSGDGRAVYERFWGQFLAGLVIPPAAFVGRTVLDVGCGSCEKAAFYHDWGARVTGIEMTASVLDLGRQVLGARNIRLVHTSIADFSPAERFDIVIADGVLHHTADTYMALRQCASWVNDGGFLVFSLVNVWGRFWWFKLARAITHILGGSDFHRRARWGQRLFAWTRGTQEHARVTSPFFRSPDSWAYDWFGNPRWNAHTPAEVRRWLDELQLTHVGSIPSLTRKPRGGVAATVMAALAGDGPRLMALTWLVTRQPNMFYISARKTGSA
jgi:2-polyprenyl-3-methyl-5-hydroxy-6-metoxy-1,4-benzoquinol methylase